MTPLTPEQSRIVENEKALLPEIKQCLANMRNEPLGPQTAVVGGARLETIIAALSLLDELAKGAETAEEVLHMPQWEKLTHEQRMSFAEESERKQPSNWHRNYERYRAALARSKDR